MWHVHFNFGVSSGKVILTSLHVDDGLKAHIFDGSYNHSECEFVICGFYATWLVDNFELLYQHFFNFSPLNKKSNADDVLFVESGKSVYQSYSSAKCVFCCGKQQRFFEFRQSVNNFLTSGYDVDHGKVYNIPIAMLTDDDDDDVNSKFEFTLNYFDDAAACCEFEVIKVHFNFVK